MARERLDAAADHVRSAAEAAAGDHAERLAGLADQLDALATRERPPDHGRLARILNAFEEVEDGGAGDAVVEHLDGAREEISAFRETIEGV